MRHASRRLRRMQRHQGRRRPASLYLVSMMDIFTILVFFLLVNSGVQEVPSTKAVQLPESVAERKPRETVVVMVTRSDILVQGNAVARLAEVRDADALIIPALEDALKSIAGRALAEIQDPSGSLGEVTVMGDRSIPYEILKKVMATCTRAGYGQVSLAVLQKAAKENS
mgnify:CR=1 FL=1